MPRRNRPNGTLNEFAAWDSSAASGTTAVSITLVTFNLDALGPHGRVPDWRPFGKRLEPGGTRDLIEEVTGGPEFEMDSAEQARRVSVEIEFTDDEQRHGSD